MLKQFIEQLSIDMGYEQGLEANDDGSYSLRLEPDIDITLTQDRDGMVRFYTEVADLPLMESEDYLFNVMSANLFGRETGGAYLGLDQEGKRVVLIDILFEEQNYRLFYERLEDFANYAEAWRRETLESKKDKEAEE